MDVRPVAVYRGGMAEPVRDTPDLFSPGEAAAALGHASQPALLRYGPVRDPDIPALLSLAQAAAELGYASKQALLNRVARGEVACARVGNSWVFRADLIAELKAAEVPE